jgi:hypothetical protein
MKIQIESTSKIVTVRTRACGAIAYEAYCQGIAPQPMPAWDQLPSLVREAWEAAVSSSWMPARIWEGHTETGIPVHCYVTRIAVQRDLDSSQFEAELQEHRAPSVEIEAIPLRLIL